MIRIPFKFAMLAAIIAGEKTETRRLTPRTIKPGTLVLLSCEHWRPKPVQELDPSWLGALSQPIHDALTCAAREFSKEREDKVRAALEATPFYGVARSLGSVKKCPAMLCPSWLCPYAAVLEACDMQTLEDVDDAAGVAEGFRDARDFRAYWNGLHANSSASDRVQVLRFRPLSLSEAHQTGKLVIECDQRWREGWNVNAPDWLQPRQEQVTLW